MVSATGLAQGPVRDGGTGTHWSFPTGGGLPSPYRDLLALPQRRRDGRATGVAHDHARRDTWPGDTFTTDPRRLWSYLERIGAVTPPRPGMRERERCLHNYVTWPAAQNGCALSFRM